MIALALLLQNLFCVSTGNLLMKMRLSEDCFIFTRGFPIPMKCHLFVLIKTLVFSVCLSISMETVGG